MGFDLEEECRRFERQLRDSKRDDDAIDHRCLVGGRQAEPGNRIARGSDGRGFGQRSRDDARGSASIVGEKAADHVGHDESGTGTAGKNTA